MEPKQAAGLRALEEVEEGMLLGLGTGTTASYFIDALGERVRSGLRVTAVATSQASEAQAAARSITALDLEPSLRKAGPGAAVSDNGNYLLDCLFDPPRDLPALAAGLEGIPGVVVAMSCS